MHASPRGPQTIRDFRRTPYHEARRGLCSAVFLSNLVSAPAFASSPPGDVAENVWSSQEPISAAGGLVSITVGDEASREPIARGLASRLETALADLRTSSPAIASGAWTITVDIIGSSHAFELAVSATDGTHSIGSEYVECPCDREALLERAEAQVLAVAKKIGGRANAPTPQSTPAAPPPVDSIAKQPSSPAARRPARIGGFGIAGVILMPLGAVSLGFGAYGMAKGAVRTESDETTFVVQYQTPTTDALFGLGIAGVVVGTVFVVIDQTICRKRPNGCRAKGKRGSVALSEGTLRF